jgi:hypothetical protein
MFLLQLYGLCTLFCLINSEIINFLYIQYDFLDEGSAHRKAVPTQNNTKNAGK